MEKYLGWIIGTVLFSGIWFLIAKKNNNQLQMKSSISTGLGVIFVFLFGLYGLILVAIALAFYFIYKYIVKKSNINEENDNINNNYDNVNQIHNHKEYINLSKITTPAMSFDYSETFHSFLNNYNYLAKLMKNDLQNDLTVNLFDKENFYKINMLKQEIIDNKIRRIYKSKNVALTINYCSNSFKLIDFNIILSFILIPNEVKYKSSINNVIKQFYYLVIKAFFPQLNNEEIYKTLSIINIDIEKGVNEKKEYYHSNIPFCYSVNALGDDNFITTYNSLQLMSQDQC